VAEGEQPQQSDEEFLSRVEEELKKLKVSDVLLQTVYTVSSLGYRRLSREDRDLEQAKLAIEYLRAVVPILGDAIPPELKRDLDQTVANMQLAYASAASEPAADTGGDATADTGGDGDS
jgi:hypothetical protein